MQRQRVAISGSGAVVKGAVTMTGTTAKDVVEGGAWGGWLP